MDRAENFSVDANGERDPLPGTDDRPLEAIHSEGQPLNERASKRAEEVFEERCRRIDELREKACLKPNPCVRALATVNAGLFETALALGDATRRVLGDGPATMEIIQENSAGISYMLRLAKQVGQFSRLELQIERSAKSPTRQPGKGRPAGEKKAGLCRARG